MRPKNSSLPDCLRDLVLVGFEDPKKKKEPPKSEKDPPEPDDDDDDDDDVDEDEDDPDQKKGSEGKGTEGLKSALNKERKERRRLDKENRRLSAAAKLREDAEKDDTTKAKDAATAEKEKSGKLAIKLKDTALDNSIIKLANGMNFEDIDDALKLIDREAIEVDQDEDDPSDIDIDLKSVKEALDALAKAKPHLLKVEGTGKAPPPKSGSKTGAGTKTKDELDEDELVSKYAALRRGR